MTNAIGMAASALSASSVTQAVAANNIANIGTSGFKASNVATRENKSGGVNAIVSRGQDSVNISKEAVSMLSNGTDFTANLKVIKASDSMTKKLLDIMA
jgi:flagellar basal body rod protein FlgB